MFTAFSLPPLLSKPGELTSKVVAISRINLHTGGVLGWGCCIIIQRESDAVPSGVDANRMPQAIVQVASCKRNRKGPHGVDWVGRSGARGLMLFPCCAPCVSQQAPLVSLYLNYKPHVSTHFNFLPLFTALILLFSKWLNRIWYIWFQNKRENTDFSVCYSKRRGHVNRPPPI